MKTNYAKITACSVLLFACVTAALSALFAAFILDVLPGSGISRAAGAAAAGIGSFCACLFAARRTRLPFFALVCAAICAIVMLCVSLTSKSSEYTVPFASPAACAAAGAAVFLITSLSKNGVKRKIKQKTIINRR